jgi:hypothetical protein
VWPAWLLVSLAVLSMVVVAVVAVVAVFHRRPPNLADCLVMGVVQ